MIACHPVYFHDRTRNHSKRRISKEWLAEWISCVEWTCFTIESGLCDGGCTPTKKPHRLWYRYKPSPIMVFDTIKHEPYAKGLKIYINWGIKGTLHPHNVTSLPCIFISQSRKVYLARCVKITNLILTCKKQMQGISECTCTHWWSVVWFAHNLWSGSLTTTAPAQAVATVSKPLETTPLA